MISNSREENLSQSLWTGFINRNNPSQTSLRPKLIYNNRAEGHRILASIQEELSSCTKFEIAVAFISRGGVVSLLQVIHELSLRKIPGRILTTDYLSFNDPLALKTLMDFPQIQVRMFHGNFHMKGYLFHKKDGTINLIVGSANLTETALSLNEEWNLKVSSTHDGEIIHQVQNDFSRIWDLASPLSDSWLDHYTQVRSNTRNTADWIQIPDQKEENFNTPVEVEVINTLPDVRPAKRTSPAPNTMQVEALKALQGLRADGQSKALLISATGTGKTYLAAFDVKSFNPDRLLYIVHRETILKSSMDSFRTVFGDERPIDFGLLTGTSKDYYVDFLFANITTLSKPEVLARFGKNHFDYIIIDEVHRAGAQSYQRVIDHFKPDFLFGMTATPERTDGKDIYALFDHNIAYNIRLNQALEQDMLAPFHYFGITDLTLNDEKIEDTSDFSLLVSDERARHIKHTIDAYSMHEPRRRGIIFCSRIDETIELSHKLNEYGMRTLALSGSDPESAREAAIARLESNSRSDYLEYILTVDIFNEGVDIPSLNQIIMVRPTQSAIIFVQQLGRGLRKFPGKPYLTVIDFVGNYSNNYLIPAALYGDISYDKDKMRKLVSAGNATLPGTSTVCFDRIARERIYEAIDSVNLNTLKFLKEQYEFLKVQLGHIPSLVDFAKAKEFDPIRFLKYAGSYPQFISKIEKDRVTNLLDIHLSSLRFLSLELAEGKRPHELLLLKMVSNESVVSTTQFEKELQSSFNLQLDQPTLRSTIRILMNEFYMEASRKSFGNLSYIRIKDNSISATPEFTGLLKNEEYQTAFFDVVELGLANYSKKYHTQTRQPNGLVLYEKYSRKDMCRLFNWDNDEHSTIYGYKIKHGTCPIFVTYKKAEYIAKSTMYEDHFYDEEWFVWKTRSGIRLNSKEPQEIMKQASSGLRIPLFIKKSDSEGSDFYYMGEVDYVPSKVMQETIRNDKGQDLPIVEFTFRLQHPIKQDLFKYLIE
jgi:superfamily II DNA or RNA helicase/HKD family nuclease